MTVRPDEYAPACGWRDLYNQGPAPSRFCDDIFARRRIDARVIGIRLDDARVAFAAAHEAAFPLSGAADPEKNAGRVLVGLGASDASP